MVTTQTVLVRKKFAHEFGSARGCVLIASLQLLSMTFTITNWFVSTLRGQALGACGMTGASTRGPREICAAQHDTVWKMEFAETPEMDSPSTPRGQTHTDETRIEMVTTQTVLVRKILALE